ncbi:MAG: oligoribonuclease [Myxococcales bacterium]|nr:MAG: oligoribonuclease [Myxococcales bacterium]
MAKGTQALLFWVDLEMSGLDPKKEHILEIASIVTDANLNAIAEGPELVIHQPDEILAAMDAWNTKHHTESGLVERVKRSSISLEEAERQTLEFARAHFLKGQVPLAGNSIHQDRRFLFKYMPALSDYLHYRNVDVSTVKELVRRWYPEVSEALPPKRNSHRALDDIRESINELRFYRDRVFRK